MAHKKELAEFLKKIDPMGWCFEKYRGTGHVELIHTSGKTAIISATPSDWRSRRNEIKQLERMAGQGLPRRKSGSFKRKREDGGYSRTHRSNPKLTREIEHAYERIERIDAELRGVDPRSHAARRLARERLALERFLSASFQPVPKINMEAS